MKIVKRVQALYHRFMYRAYALRIKLAFKRVDWLLARNRRGLDNAGTMTGEEFNKRFAENRARGKKIDAIYRRVHEYHDLEDRHWYRWSDLRIEYVC